MESVYLETTIPSYLSAQSSRIEPIASYQKITHRWWMQERHRFLVYSSLFVREEVSRGAPVAVSRRLACLKEIPELPIPKELDRIEAELIRLFQLPPKAATDASHLAMAILHRIDYLLTWNCTHLANASLQRSLLQYCLYHQLHVPIICIPETLITPAS